MDEQGATSGFPHLSLICHLSVHDKLEHKDKIRALTDLAEQINAFNEKPASLKYDINSASFWRQAIGWHLVFDELLLFLQGNGLPHVFLRDYFVPFQLSTAEMLVGSSIDCTKKAYDKQGVVDNEFLEEHRLRIRMPKGMVDLGRNYVVSVGMEKAIR